MRKSRLSRTRRPVASAAFLIATGAAFAAKPTVTASLSAVSLDRSAIQAGQTVQVTYTLTGAASTAGLKIEFLKNGSVVKDQSVAATAPEAAAGTHTVLADTTGLANGDYTVRVSAPAGPLAAYVQVSDSSNPAVQFDNPRGVDVNNVAGSPAFGRIYVTEGAGGSTTGRETVNGLYMLNPDLTEVAGAPKATNTDLEAIGLDDWNTATNSPFRVTVGPDGHVYMTDWSDPHSGLFETDADGNNLAAVLFFPTGSHGSGLVLNNNSGSPMYGSMSSVWVQGTGDARTFYTTDEDLTPGNSVWKYTVPAGQADANVDPVLAVDLTGAASSSSEDVVRDSDGNFYVVSLAANEAYKYDANGTQLAKFPDTGAAYAGIAINDAKNLIAILGANGTVYLTDKSFAAVKGTVHVTSSGNTRDVALDADGWLYVVNSADELLYVLAGPGTPVTAGQANAATTLTVASPVPGDISPVGTAGLFVGPNGHRYGDGKVTIEDAVVVLRVAAGLNQIP